MADGRRPMILDGRRPNGKARASDRHFRPRASAVSVRAAVANYLLARHDWREATATRNAAILAQFVWFAERERWPAMQELANAHLRSFLAYLNTPGPRWGSTQALAARPLSQGRKNKIGAVIRRFVRWAIEEDLCSVEVAKNVQWPAAPKMTDSMLAIPSEDLSRLLAACDSRAWHGVRDYAIVMLLYDTGIRRGELLAMRIADVEEARAASVVSGKSGTRGIGMGVAARRAVRDYLHRARYAVDTDHDMLWIARDGEPLGTGGIRKILDRLKAAAGIEGRIYPHKFRHTFASEWIKNGGNAFTLQVALGHTNPAVTAAYVHLASADVEHEMQRLSPADALLRKARRS